MSRDRIHRRASLIKAHINVSPMTSAYVLVKQLGSGSSGTVFLVRHVESQKHFAMKTLSRDTLSPKRHIELCTGAALGGGRA